MLFQGKHIERSKPKKIPSVLTDSSSYTGYPLRLRVATPRWGIYFSALGFWDVSFECAVEGFFARLLLVRGSRAR